MIYHLQKKVIRICGGSVLLVFTVIFFLICSFSTRQLNETMDMLTDRISENDGRFPEWRDDRGHPGRPAGVPDFMTAETPFSTRFFTVRFDESGRERGWMGNYRYRQYRTEHGTIIVYVDGSMNRFMSNRMLFAAGGVLIISAFAIWIIVIFFSKRAVRPVAESYEKQR